MKRHWTDLFAATAVLLIEYTQKQDEFKNSEVKSIVDIGIPLRS